MSKHLIELVDINKSYGEEYALKDVNLYIRDGEFLTLLGPSGCGKTTMLRIIAGFTMPTSGKVLMDNMDISAVPPYKRRVNTVFQKYALFPHLNVFDNVAFGLKIQKQNKNEIEQKVNETLELVNLKNYGKRWIEQLSGGQQQRVAIARALVNRPQVLLLDEPLGALDLKLRKSMQLELKKMQKHLGITFVYVTHDQEEALTMSDSIVVMNEGIIQQIGTPTDIYNEPKNVFVAKFIGESNIFPGIMKKNYLVNMHSLDYECVDKGFLRNQEVDVVVRPEDIDIVDVNDARLRGVITDIVFMGVHYAFTVQCADTDFIIHSTDYVPVGSEVGINILPDAIHIMHKSTTSDAIEEPLDADELELDEDGNEIEEE